MCHAGSLVVRVSAANLNPCPAGVIQPNDRRTHLRRQIHDLHDLRRIGFRKRPAEYREILRENEHQPSFNPSIARDEPVAVILLLLHAKIVRTMRHQLVSLLERALIEQKLDTLTGVHLAFFMLPLAPQRAAAFFGETVAFLQFLKLLFEVHGGEIIGEELQSLMEDGRASHPSPSIRERCAAGDARAYIVLSYSMVDPSG